MLRRTDIPTVLVIATILFGRATAETRAEIKPLPGNELYERAKAASVEMLVNDHLQGSGFLVDPEGWIITVAHMFNGQNQRIEARSPGIGRVDAKIVALDLGADMALLRIAPRKGGYPYFPLAKEIPPPGTDVFVYGTPVYRHGVLMRANVARNDTTFEYYGNRRLYTEIVHLTGNGPRGVSGGPWMNWAGEIIGMQSGAMVNKDAQLGVTFMAPLSAVRRMVEQKKHAATATLGIAIEETWQQQGDFLKRIPPRTEGLVVRILHKDGPTAKAGIKQWDVITAVDGKKVLLPKDLLHDIRSKKPGTKVRLTILSPGKPGTRDVDVTLGHLEANFLKPKGQPPKPKDAEPADAFTHVIAKETEYYKTGPQQAEPPNGRFAAGTKVRILQKAGSYTRVQAEDGTEAHVSTGALKELAKPK